MGVSHVNWESSQIYAISLLPNKDLKATMADNATLWNNRPIFKKSVMNFIPSQSTPNIALFTVLQSVTTCHTNLWGGVTLVLLNILCAHIFNIFPHLWKGPYAKSCILKFFSLAKLLPSQRFLQLWKETEVPRAQVQWNVVGVQKDSLCYHVRTSWQPHVCNVMKNDWWIHEKIWLLSSQHWYRWCSRSIQ
jgi:hypothetical protein